MENTDDFVMPDSDNEKFDRRLNVRFSIEARIDHAKTQETGQEHYRDLEFVTIFIPGDKTLSVHRPVQTSDKIRFRENYRNFKENLKTPEQGSPLNVWPLVSPSQRKELEYLNCRTVEQLAGMSDLACQSMMGALGLRLKAQTFLKAKLEDAGLIKMTNDLQKRDDQIAALQDQLTKLAELVEQKVVKTGK